MTDRLKVLIDDFDHNSAEVQKSIPAIYGEMHKCPVLHTSNSGGYHVISRRQEVSDLALNHETFANSNDLGEGPGGGILIPASPVRLGFLETDPPEHTPLKRVVTTWFQGDALRAYFPRMREVVNAHVERVAQLQAFDVVDELANPLTAMLTLDYFGLPTEDWELYVKPVHEQAFLKPGDREFPRLLMDIERAQAKLRELIAERRKAPGSDLVSVLIATEDENGVLLSDDRIVEVIWVVFGGGFDTTSSLIAHILRYLSENPERKAVLVGTPSLLPSAVDEFVRYFAPAVFSGRTVTEDVTVGGVRMAPGDRVLLSWAASNFDEDAFPVPYEIQFDRKPNRHLSFGWGVHRCPGANFARQELVMVLESILELMPDLVVDGDAAVPLPNASVVNGYISMPATTR